MEEGRENEQKGRVAESERLDCTGLTGASRVAAECVALLLVGWAEKGLVPSTWGVAEG